MRVLRQVPYFAGLSDDELQDIDGRMRSLAWSEGDRLYQVGDPAEHLYVLAAGHVKLGRATAAGGETITAIVAPGQLFGAMSTLGEPVHTETATALVTSCALRMSQRAFREVLDDHPQVALRVLDDVAARLARANLDIGHRATDTVPQRVATALLRLADKVGGTDDDRGTLLELPLSRADLAGLTSSTTESVSRAMSRLRKDGIIDSGRRWTAILDRPRLEQVAAGAPSGTVEALRGPRDA